MMILSANKQNLSNVLSELRSAQLIQEFSREEADLDLFQSVAVDGFAVLGTNAEPVIPQIRKLVDMPEYRVQAMNALMNIGPRGFSSLTNHFDYGNEEMRNNLIFAVGAEYAGNNSKAMLDFMIASLKDPNPINRAFAADSLGNKSPDIVIPALIGMLDDAESDPRSAAIIALRAFGAGAKSAVPKLISVYRDIIASHNKDLIEDLGPKIEQTIKKIDPDADLK